MKYCLRCRAENHDLNLYCEQCGDKFEEPRKPGPTVVIRKKGLFRKEAVAMSPAMPQPPRIDSVPQPNYWGGAYPLTWWADPQEQDYQYEGWFMRKDYWIIDLITEPVVLEPVRTVPVFRDNYPIPAKCSSCGWHGDWNMAPYAAHTGDGFKGRLCPLCGERLI